MKQSTLIALGVAGIGAWLLWRHSRATVLSGLGRAVTGKAVHAVKRHNSAAAAQKSLAKKKAKCAAKGGYWLSGTSKSGLPAGRCLHINTKRGCVKAGGAWTPPNHKARVKASCVVAGVSSLAPGQCPAGQAYDPSSGGCWPTSLNCPAGSSYDGSECVDANGNYSCPSGMTLTLAGCLNQATFCPGTQVCDGCDADDMPSCECPDNYDLGPDGVTCALSTVINVNCPDGSFDTVDTTDPTDVPCTGTCADGSTPSYNSTNQTTSCSAATAAAAKAACVAQGAAAAWDAANLACECNMGYQPNAAGICALVPGQTPWTTPTGGGGCQCPSEMPSLDKNNDVCCAGNFFSGGYCSVTPGLMNADGSCPAGYTLSTMSNECLPSQTLAVCPSGSISGLRGFEDFACVDALELEVTPGARA